MTPESSEIMQGLLRSNDLGWIIDMYAPPERAVPDLLERLASLATEFRSRFHHNVPFSPEQLVAEAERNPHQVRAFLQALAVSRNLDMLMMVWRILHGCSIHEVVLNYREKQDFNLTVKLANGEDGKDGLETYRSSDINDAALLRHFGIMTMDSRPLFDGFFPLRKG